MDVYEDRLTNAVTIQIRVEMLERGMRQKDLSEAVGIERATLNRYLKGHRTIPMPTLFRIAEGLGMDASEFLLKAEARIPAADRRISP